MSQNHFPQEQRANLIERLNQALQRRVDEDEISFDKAFSQVALDILGYSTDSGTMSDGRGDFGIDFWTGEDRTTTVFQMKSHDFSSILNPEYMAEPKLIADISRIHSLFANLENIPEEANSKIKTLIKELRSSIHRYGLTPRSTDSPYDLTVFFCCLAKGFTPQAAEEFKLLSAPRQFNIGSQTVLLSTLPIFIDDLIAEDWRESNTDWKTSDGKRSDTTELNVCGEMITASKSLVFFTKAFDLVQAFDRFGYQMFEPNVRCELKRSKVNEAIRDSIKHHRTRKEFQHLNNGITLICSGFRKINRSGKSVIEVQQPGIINGLQTVKSIHDAFDELNDSDKKHFTEECQVLVRLHTRQAVADYKDLVTSTNNQNPMQPRNLKSNQPEQVMLEKYFSHMNWFYERKEGAWKAYRSDSNLWGSLRGKKISDFRGARPQVVKNIDNLEMAQAWMSFIGFSNEAIHNKKDIFIDERYYDLVFKKRVIKHGFAYGLAFGDSAVRGEAEEQAPNPPSLLLSQLLREMADGLTPSRRQHREAAIKRLRLEKLKKEEQDNHLIQDASYIRGLVLAGAKYLFVDFCGLVLFEALGSDVYRHTDTILKSRSMKSLYLDRNVEPIETFINMEDYAESDIILTIWALFNYCLENIIEQASWRQQFEQAAVRSRFNYSDYNRRALFSELYSLDRVYQRRAIPRPWSEGFENNKGVFSYVSQTLGVSRKSGSSEAKTKRVTSG